MIDSIYNSIIDFLNYFKPWIFILVLISIPFIKEHLRKLKSIKQLESFLNNQKDKNIKIIEKAALILTGLIFIIFSFWIVAEDGVGFENFAVMFLVGLLLLFIYPLLIYLILLVPGFLLLLLNKAKIIRLKKNKINNLILNSGALFVFIILVVLIEILTLGSILAAIFTIYLLHFKKDQPKEGGFEYLSGRQRFLLYVILEDLCKERNYSFRKDEIIASASKHLRNGWYSWYSKKNIDKIIQNDLSELVDKGILTEAVNLPCWQISDEIYLHSSYYRYKLKNDGINF